MIPFTHYYGHEVWLNPVRVLWVEDGGCGSRGLSTVVHLDTGEQVSLLGRADTIQRKLAEAYS